MKDLSKNLGVVILLIIVAVSAIFFLPHNLKITLAIFLIMLLVFLLNMDRIHCKNVFSF